jgi:S1-C subfamily serine protease
MNKPSVVQAVAEIVRGVPVWGVLPGSAAGRAGVRRGDIVVEVNGVATPTVDAFFEARRKRDDAAEIVLFRGGERVLRTLILGSADASGGGASA